MKPFISDEASKIRRNRALGTLGLAGLVTAGYNFTKDHDYCVVNGTIVVDPTVYDFLH